MALKPGITNMEHDPQLAADYRLAATEAPPAALDERIRAAARREVGAGPQRTLRRPAWQKPLSLAAVVVLSVTLVLMMREEGVDRIEPEVLPPAAEAPAAQVAAEPAAKQGAAESRLASPVPPPASPAITGELQKMPEPADRSTSMAARSRSTMEVPAPAIAPPRDEAAFAENTVAPARETVRPLLRTAPAAATADAAAGPAPGAAAPAALSAPVPARPLWHDLVNEPAAKWLQRIAEWRRAGRAADADVLITEFRRRFPDQSVPDAPAAP